MGDFKIKFLESKTRSKITEQRTAAQDNPKSELTHAIFEKYGIGGLSFIMRQRVYRFRENYIRGKNGEYEALSHPYLPANGLMLDVSELRAVRGIDAALYRRLLPYVCVIPEKTLQINVNTLRTIQAPLLAALFLNNLSVDDARNILEQRPREGWNSVAEFLELGALSNTAAAGDQVQSALTIKSFYFLATLQAETDRYQTRIVSLFQRQSNNQVTVIRRHFGGLE